MTKGTTPPWLIAHRGASQDAPENTLAAFLLAHQQGARWIECDVCLTQDGVPVIFHDETLERTSSGHGPVAAAPWSVIGSLDAGSWFSPRFALERIPSLQQLCSFLGHWQMGANIELKPTPGLEVQTAQAALHVLAQHWPQNLPPPLISSFSFEALQTVHTLAPDLALGLLIDEGPLPSTWRDQARAINAFSVHIPNSLATAERCLAIQQAGYRVLVYTVNTVERQKTLKDWGVTAIFTDCPGAMGSQ